MDLPPPPPTAIPLEEIVSSINALLGTKYLAAAALVCALWDHVVTVDEEYKLIWHRSWDLTKVVYLLNRYGIEICLIYVCYTVCALRLMNLCKTFVLVLCILTIVYSVSANAYVTIRHYSLWDHRPVITATLIIALVITYVPVFVLGSMGIRDYYNHMQYIPLLDTCLVSTQPNSVKGVWGCMVAFDVFVIGLTCANALDRPRRHHHEVLNNMRRDGALSFGALFCMRLLNLLLNVILPPTEIYLAIFLTWSLISITLSRMILRLEDVKRPRGIINTWVPAVNSFELGRWSHRDLELLGT